MFELVDTLPQEAVIKVIGVGGCGGNAIDHMIEMGVQGVEFISANTDAQALSRNKAKTLLQLGSDVTKGWRRRRLRSATGSQIPVTCVGHGLRPSAGRELRKNDQRAKTSRSNIPAGAPTS